MAIGPKIRARLGKYEPLVAEAYRSVFVDLDHLITEIKSRVPARKILEIGCGEGALVERLARAYPVAEITGIDLTDRVGRLYQGRQDGVRFEQATTAELASRRDPEAFDIVLISDVLHHVEPASREDLLRQAVKLSGPDGALVVKDWVRGAQPIHLLSWLSDRVITGDNVQYPSLLELRGLLQTVSAGRTLSEGIRIKPWRNNVMFILKR